MKKVSFEDACLVSHVSAKELREGSIKELMDRKRKALAEVGWTDDGLNDDHVEMAIQRLLKDKANDNP